MKTIGVILAGGNSTRFGEDKSLYPLDGKPMYQHIADSIRSSHTADEIIVSTNVRLKTSFEYETVVDDGRFMDKGPLGGLFAAARAYPDCRLLVISCDTPYVPPAWLKELHDAAVQNSDAIILTKAADHLHPLIGVYQGGDLGAALERQLKTGRLSMKAFFENRKTIELEAAGSGVEEHTLININRKTDLL
ncbi:molybdenum cofactor guanylyltransferase [Salinicoccus sp. HZC-1]|uniref:molybdenum cofactor guanylyltransferase n=1 Tax=Salinicoccus sp. HZC-1 TaxID=3385497 RepID=UPI00398A9340